MTTVESDVTVSVPAPTPSIDDEQRELTRIIDRLTETFPNLSTDDVELIVMQAFREFDDAPVRNFVPLLVEKHAKDACRRRTREQAA